LVDLRHLPVIVSLSTNEARVREPELRTSSVSLNVNMRRFVAVAGPKSERVAGFSIQGGHAEMVVGGRYRRLTIGLWVGSSISAYGWRPSSG